MMLREMFKEEQIDYFTKEMMEEGEDSFLVMGLREDELVLLEGLMKMLMEVGLMMGMEPSIEMASIQGRFSEALHQFYGEE